jgi:hypothetical protein
MTDIHSIKPGQAETGIAGPLPHPTPSPRRRMLLALAVAVFLLWLGYLAYLAATTAHPVVLSRPQLLVSNLVVIAELSGTAKHPDAKAGVKVREVFWTTSLAAKPLVNAKISIPEFGPDPIAQAIAAHGLTSPGAALPVIPQNAVSLGVGVFDASLLGLVGPKEGWAGPGEYILPLMQRTDGTSLLTRIPPSPGYNALGLRIYPATPSTRQELAEIERRFHRR